MVTLVAAAKKISGVGTGPWTVEYVVFDGDNFEIGKSSLEEGTGPSGEDRLMRDGTIYDSSNGGSAVVWGVGERDVIIAPSSQKMASLTDELTTNGLIERTGDDAYAIQSVTSFGRSLVNVAGAAATRALLAVGAFGESLFLSATLAAARALLENEYYFTTGDVKLTLKTVADSGWVMMDDGTIGDTGSGGTTRADPDCEALFLLLYTIPDAWCPVPGGRGASAAADWAAGKTITLPRTLGRALAVSGSGAGGLTPRVRGEYLGKEDANTAHWHYLAHATTATGGFLSGTNRMARALGPPFTGNAEYSLANSVGGAESGITSTTGDASDGNMQPSSFLNVMVHL
jgi:hypothetical protein